jgi:lipopolysaccharide/colanic/teichoic acid biosynthesis glycosyltransferase
MFLGVPLFMAATPIMIIISILIRINMGKGVLFKQVRPGYLGCPFVMYKFRTMKNISDKKNRPLPDRERLTKLGWILRSASLDELPELLNVLKGDMNLVGPRPLLIQYLDRYSPTQARRHEVKPGITGWAQVHGRNAISWEQKFKLDVWYVDNQSLALDLRIIFMTIKNVLRRVGISAQGETTMPEFIPKNSKIESDQNST